MCTVRLSPRVVLLGHTSEIAWLACCAFERSEAALTRPMYVPEPPCGTAGYACQPPFVLYVPEAQGELAPGALRTPYACQALMGVLCAPRTVAP